jgi:hypothetical protein
MAGPVWEFGNLPAAGLGGPLLALAPAQPQCQNTKIKAPAIALLGARFFPRVDIVLYFDRFDGVPEHLFLSLTVGVSEAVMLPLVFRPRVDFEALQVGVRRLCIDEDSPAYRAIAATNALILVDLMEKLGSFRRINYILHGDEDRSLVGVRFLDHGRFNPVIPDAEIQLSIRQSEPGP